MPNLTHYEILGISPAASADEIKKRFRELARKFHPDVAPGNENEIRFREINAAYQILSDSDKRTFYDAELKLAALKQPRPSAGTSASNSSSSPTGGTGQSASGSRSRTSTEARRRRTETILEEAQKAMRRMRHRDAESLCKEALRLDRRSVTAYEILGDIHKARGRTDEAIAMFSYALQLDRNNVNVRAKFDKMVGQTSGPTMAGHAARSSRHSGRRTTAYSAERHNRQVLLIANGILFGLVVFLLIAVAGLGAAASSLNPLDWHPVLLTGLCLSGLVGGFVLTTNRVIPRCRRELGAAPRMDGRGLAVPVGLIVIGFGAFWFYAGLLAYAAIAMARRAVSPGIVAVYCWSLGALAIFALAAKSGAANVLLLGGNVVLICFIGGWILGDGVRTRIHGAP